MKPMPTPSKNPQQDLFRSELEQIIDTKHPLAKLAKTINWEHLEQVFRATFSPDLGRPAINTRLLVALHYLKYMHNMSDERTLELWTENPYWQYLSGMKFFGIMHLTKQKHKKLLFHLPLKLERDLMVFVSVDSKG